MRSLVETGVLVGAKSAYRPGLRAAEIQMPDTVQNIVADRIDHLSFEEKHLLQTAAVIGVIVPGPLLRDVSDLPEASFQSGLTHLQTAEFLYESKLFPEKEYTFKHALMNEVAYSALVHSRKVYLHAKIVNAFESAYRGNLQEHIEAVAQHAYRGELWSEALTYSWQAGKKASGRSANQEAREFFQAALAALSRLPQSKENLERSIDLRFDLRNALFLLNEFRQGFEQLEEAKKSALAIDDQERLGKLYTWMTAYWNLEGNSEQAVLTGHRALDHSLSSTSTDCQIVAHYFLGVAYHNLGQFQISIEQLRRALALIGEARRYELFGTTGIVSVVCKGWLIRGLAQIGEFDATAEIADNAIRTAGDREHPFSIAYANCAVGTVALLRGELDQAILQLERALQVCHLAGIPVLRPLVVSSLAAARALAGNSNEASVHLASTASFRERLAKADERQLPFGKAMRLVWEILAFINVGQVAEAESLASHVLSVAMKSKDKGSEAWLQFLIGDILRRRRAWGEAQSRFENALELARSGGLLPLQAHSHLGLGSCQSQLNHRTNAESELNQALAFYRRLRMPYWSGLAEGALTALS